MKDRYVYPAIFDVAEDGISIDFPDLPGCLPCGETEEEALANAKEALMLHLFGMEEDGDEIPPPSRITDLTLEKNQIAVLIEVWMPPFRDKMANKSINKTLTLPRWLNNLAEREKVNFSHVLQAALKRHLGIEDHPQVEKQP
ncbi:MAG: type II toxin-antitoxin system HicB family antitoxin [Bacillota bacterium]